MSKHLGRKLQRCEDVHHKDNDKLNFALSNLQLIDHRDHGWVSGIQQWYVTNVVEPKRKEHFMSYFHEDVSFDVTQEEYQ